MVAFMERMWCAQNGRRSYHGCLTVFACKRKVIVDILVFIYLSFQLSCIKIKHYAFSEPLWRVVKRSAHQRIFTKISPHILRCIAMSRAAPSIPTTLRLNPNAPLPTQKQIHISSKLFSPAPILRFTVGKYSQLPPAESPEVVILGRSNVGVSLHTNRLSYLSSLFLFSQCVFWL